MTTVTLQIGNSDDKLSQAEWSNFFRDCHDCIIDHSEAVHFAAPSIGSALWQNGCFVAEISDDDIAIFSLELTAIRMRYRQDSVAVTYGKTAFV